MFDAPSDRSARTDFYSFRSLARETHAESCRRFCILPAFRNGENPKSLFRRLGQASGIEARNRSRSRRGSLRPLQRPILDGRPESCYSGQRNSCTHPSRLSTPQTWAAERHIDGYGLVETVDRLSVAGAQLNLKIFRIPGEAIVMPLLKCSQGFGRLAVTRKTECRSTGENEYPPSYRAVFHVHLANDLALLIIITPPLDTKALFFGSTYNGPTMSMIEQIQKDITEAMKARGSRSFPPCAWSKRPQE